MRVNHTGEVCAQALYRGQALLARHQKTRRLLLEAQAEENDHLVWCAERLAELQASPSRLNGLWGSLSFGLGVLAAMAGDSVSLGFMAATEERVCQHLEGHLKQLPAEDVRSKAIIEKMLVEEAHHGHKAAAQTNVDFPAPVKKAMTQISRAMTQISYYI